ncbi:hypothetical protein B0H14DRAFT_2646294 [Mycena olivaceomarginata]|nr:hypothetical protein B0H14DRAFT_2646294 [Mycena olivaceomarginata]
MYDQKFTRGFSSVVEMFPKTILWAFSAKRCLLWIHLLLDLSWQELRVAICPLREIVGKDAGLVRTLVHGAPTMHLRETPTGGHDSNSFNFEYCKGWPACDGSYSEQRFTLDRLNLCEIGQRLIDHSYRFFLVDGVDLHNIVQWLKIGWDPKAHYVSGIESVSGSTNPAFERLLEEQYSEAVSKKIDSRMIDSSFKSLEKEWQDWPDEHKEFLDHSVTESIL